MAVALQDSVYRQQSKRFPSRRDGTQLFDLTSPYFDASLRHFSALLAISAKILWNWRTHTTVSSGQREEKEMVRGSNNIHKVDESHR
jgi:hypothetical protein